MRVSIFCLLMTVLAGCTVLLEPKNDNVNVEGSAGDSQVVINSHKNNLLINVIEDLADTLFDSPDLISFDSNVAVGTFTNITTLALQTNDSHAFKHLGVQLQEGLKSELARKRIRVIEFRLRNSIALKEGQDVMLSRDLAKIQTNHDIDYFLTGTLTEQPVGIIINAQLVDVRTKQIVTAATKALPQSYWSGPANSTISNQFIYRTSK